MTTNRLPSPYQLEVNSLEKYVADNCTKYAHLKIKQIFQPPPHGCGTWDGVGKNQIYLQMWTFHAIYSTKWFSELTSQMTWDVWQKLAFCQDSDISCNFQQKNYLVD